MKLPSRSWNALKRFFFPPNQAPRWLKVLPYLVLGVLTLLVFIGGSYAWDYTNSSSFCGQACHTMPPEYTAYKASPHANVPCTACHIGQAPFLVQFWRKAGDLKHVVELTLGNYTYPIYARNLRPADQTCLKCHSPVKFSAASLLQKRHYGDDPQNTPTDIYLILNTGGGNQQGEVGPFIHWHATGQVQFLALDADQQEIPYIRVTLPDGKMREYYDVSTGLQPEDIHGQTLQRMDCITCHNRIAHLIPTPAEVVDRAMAEGTLPADLPDLHRKAVEVLSGNYTSRQAGLEAIADLETYYRQQYPTVWSERADEIRQAIQTLQALFQATNFPEQKLNYATHPNNLGHTSDPGCFRCHDGKHLTPTGEAIPFACSTCHSIPEVVTSDQPVVELRLDTSPRPPTHSNTLWPVLHGRMLDDSCATCHPPVDPTLDYTQLQGPPPSDGSFCGNEACHNAWPFAGWDEPALRPILDRALYVLQNTSPYLLEGAPRTYEGTFKAIFDGRCVFCHSGPDAKADLDLSTYQGILQGGKHGPGIVPGDLDASLIWQRQTRRKAHFGQMLDDELEALRDWILAGAPER